MQAVRWKAYSQFLPRGIPVQLDVRYDSSIQGSHAVMAQRIEATDSPDDFPTPPWATRGFMEYVIEDQGPFASMSCLEPACGGIWRRSLRNTLERFVLPTLTLLDMAKCGIILRPP